MYRICWLSSIKQVNKGCAGIVLVPLEEPVPYEHKSGAVTWVSLSHDVQEKLSTMVPLDGATDAEERVLRFPTDARQKPPENVTKASVNRQTDKRHSQKTGGGPDFKR